MKHIYKLGFIAVVLCTSFLTLSYAEGTKQLSPIEAQNASLNLVANNGWGPTFNSSVDSRLRFYINNHTIENFYFGAQCRTQGSSSFRTDIYYRILDSNNTVVAGPLVMPSATSETGFISSYAQAVAGPQIGTLNPTGYVPLIFDPSVNGEYHIEIYSSTNSGSSSSNSSFIMPLFDFSVGTSTGVIPGRLYCQAWSIRATKASDNYQGQFADPVDPVFYAYTPDSTAVKVTFSSFNPLSALIGFNSFGVNSTISDWTIGRKSVNGTPNLTDGFFTFLSLPDSNVFAYSRPAAPPILNTEVTGCPGNYQINFYTAASGDVFINLDQNGIPGYQPNTSDLQLLKANATAGWDSLSWDGLDGLNNPVTPGAVITFSTVLRRGRVNLPIYDAEWNINGFTLTREKPVFKNNIEMFWDDSELVNVSGNTTGAGIDNSVQGQFSPGHAWNGTYGTSLITPPAPDNGGGSATPTSSSDDFGNVRTLNTWFFGFDTLSTTATLNMSPCAPLPIHFMKLSLLHSDDNNTLLLETENENNTNYFTLEYSKDGVAFNDVEQLKAAGTSIEKREYKFITQKETTDAYYRVRVTDIDGKEYISNTVFVSPKKKNNGLSIFPNPVRNKLNVQFDDMEGLYTIKLYNINGTIIYTDNVEINTPNKIISINRNKIAKGVYYLNIINEESHEELKQTIVFDDLN